jgi:hypothetical protein
MPINSEIRRTISNQQYRSFSVTGEYIDNLCSGKTTLASFAAKITILASPIIALVALLTDLFLAIFHDLIDKNREANTRPSQYIGTVRKIGNSAFYPKT